MKEDSNSAAEIDIALEWDSSTKKVIKAVIERNAQEPKYYVDSKPFSRKMVAELAKGANINPGNMCQFLPQEKVSHFSRMDHKVLFMNVLKAIGEERALQAYHDLDKLTERHKEASEKLQSQDEKIARKTAEVASLGMLNNYHAFYPRDRSNTCKLVFKCVAPLTNAFLRSCQCKYPLEWSYRAVLSK